MGLSDMKPRHLKLEALEPNDCRWPFGDGPFTFCGHPKAFGSSYCEHHKSEAYVAGSSARSKAKALAISGFNRIHFGRAA